MILIKLDNDWKLFLKQRLHLFHILDRLKQEHTPEARAQIEALDGLQNWFEDVLDQAEAKGEPVLFLSADDETPCPDCKGTAVIPGGNTDGDMTIEDDMGDGTRLCPCLFRRDA